MIYRLWFEQALPPEFQTLLGDEAIIVGSARDTPDDPLVALPHAEGIIAGPAIQYDGALMDCAPALRVISRTGIGVDNIVISDATARGIIVCNTPDAPTISTAEQTLALLLAAAKRLKEGARDVERGTRKDFFATYRGIQLDGLCLGIIGVGRIGSRVARLAQAFRMRVVGWDRSWTPADAARLELERAESLESLLWVADIVSLHIPYSPATRHIINAQTLAQMKPGAYLVNTARGGLIDQQALLDALERGHLAGAGLDVFDPEPVPADHPLLQRDDVIIVPHVGGATAASRSRLWHDALTQTLQALRGERPPHVVNPEVMETRRT